MKFFTTSARLFRPLLAMLILVTVLKSSVVGKALGPSTTSKAPGCLELDDQGFPQSVNVNISIINATQPNRVVPDPSKRSTSPWDYSTNEDPNRFPFSISEAQCRHIGCMDARGQEMYSMNSVPIQQEILVIRRQYRGCEKTYQLEKQWITVGCTCARAQIIASA